MNGQAFESIRCWSLCDTDLLWPFYGVFNTNLCDLIETNVPQAFTSSQPHIWLCVIWGIIQCIHNHSEPISTIQQWCFSSKVVIFLWCFNSLYIYWNPWNLIFKVQGSATSWYQMKLPTLLLFIDPLPPNSPLHLHPICHPALPIIVKHQQLSVITRSTFTVSSGSIVEVSDAYRFQVRCTYRSWVRAVLYHAPAFFFPSINWHLSLLSCELTSPWNSLQMEHEWGTNDEQEGRICS